MNTISFVLTPLHGTHRCKTVSWSSVPRVGEWVRLYNVAREGYETWLVKDVLYVEVPILDHDVHDLRSLAKIARYLVGDEMHEAVTR